MKKYFFYAAAAIAMLASCQKSELKSERTPVVDDSTPVAIEFGVNAPSFSAAVTKAAVDSWNNTEVYIYGLERNVDEYDLAEGILIDNVKANVISEEEPLKVVQETSGAPYYYGEGKTYDFFGYHYGNAELGEVAKADDNASISYPVTISGQDDLMYAAADKANDILDDTSADGVTVNDVYSAWAARRNVQPTLVFNHALSRFNFIVRGMNEKSEEVTVTEITMTDLFTTGTFTVVGQDLGFVADEESEAKDLTLGMEDAAVVVGNKEAAGYLMVAPKLKDIHVKVDMTHNLADLEPYEFDVNASQVLKDNVAAELTEFEAGCAYNIYINVYGPEEIVIKAELTDWEMGGDYTYDPDQRPVTTTTSVTAERTVENNVISYAINYSDDIEVLQGAIATDVNAVTEWTTLINTKGVTGLSYELKDGENAADFKLFVQYTTNADVTDTVQVHPAFKITKSYLVTDQDSFDTLPAGYREAHPWDEATEATLPWIAVEFTPGAAVSGTAQCGNFTYEIKEATSTIGLLTLSAEEMGLTSLTGGEWTITLNGVRTKVTVWNDSYAPIQNLTLGYVYDEKSYNEELWASYLSKYPWETVEGYITDLPWLCLQLDQLEFEGVETYTLSFECKAPTASEWQAMSLYAAECEYEGLWTVGASALTVNAGKLSHVTLSRSCFTYGLEAGDYRAKVVFNGEIYYSEILTITGEEEVYKPESAE